MIGWGIDVGTMTMGGTQQRWDGVFQEGVQQAQRAGESPGLLAARAAAYARFRERGLPTRQEEDWRYTDVSDVGTSLFRLPRPDWTIDPATLPAMTRADEVQLIFVDGLFMPDQSSLAAIPGLEVRVLDGRGGQGVIADFEALWAEGSAGEESAFTALNQALATSTVRLRLEAGVRLEKRMHVLHLTTGLIPNLMTAPRLSLRIGRGASARVVQSHIGSPVAIGMTNAVTDVHLEDEAELFFCKVQSEGADALHFSRLRLRQAAASRLSTLDFSIGARLSRNEVQARLEGEGATLECNGLYAVKGRQHVDHHTTVEHARPRAVSRQLYKGILDDKARAVFSGRIVVRPGAVQTDAFQMNRNLLLSRGAHVDTKPQLEIANDDVRCTHGATIGQMSAAELFYLVSRGIGPAEARAILSRGFVEEVLFGVADVPLRDSLRDVLGSFFDAGAGEGGRHG